MASHPTADHKEQPAETKQKMPTKMNKPTPEWSMVWLTAILALFAAVSAWVVYGQLDEMQRATRLEQRGWIKMTTGDYKFAEGQPFSIEVTLLNYGKTPARVVHGDVVVELLDVKQVPELDYAQEPRNIVSTGIMFPNDSPKFNAVLFNGMGERGMGKDRILSREDVANLTEGRSYISVHAQITFWDIFGYSHWVHFCNFQTFSATRVATLTKACSDYNGVDDN